MRHDDPNHTSVCAVCWRGTWYADATIEVRPAERGRAAFVTHPEEWERGQRAHEHGTPGAQNLKMIDRSGLAPQFHGYFKSGERIRVRTTYPSGETFERTGTVGRTIGPKQAYMLVHRSTDMGSWDILGKDDVVIAVRHDVRDYYTGLPREGRKYTPTGR